MKMKTITIKGRITRLPQTPLSHVVNTQVPLLGYLPGGPAGANLSESVYIGDGPKRKMNKVVIFNLAGLVISLALLVSVIAFIAIDVIGAQL